MYKMITSTGKAVDISAKGLSPEALKMLIDDNQGGGNLYQRVSWLYAVVNWRARQISSLPRRILNSGGDEVDENDLPFKLDLSRLLYQAELSLQLTASFYWLKVKNRRGDILGARWLSPDTMTPTFNASEGLTDFTRNLNGNKVVIPLNDVVWCWLPSLNELGPGVAPSQVAKDAAELLANTSGYGASFFGNGAFPGIILSVDGNPRPDEMDKLEGVFKKKSGGLARWFKTVALRSTVTPTVIQQPISDLAMPELTQVERENIAAAFGLSTVVIDGKSANFATAQMAKKNAIEDTITPEAGLIAECLNSRLFGDFGLTLEFMPQQLSVMQEDEEERSGAVLNLVNAGMSLEAALATLGYDIPDGVTVDAPTETPQEAMRARELSRLKRWAKRRKNPDASKFTSDILTPAEIEEALTATDAPFLDWTNYP